MIIDAHCHAGKGDGLSGPWDTEAPLDLYLRHAADGKIDRTIVFPAFHTDYAVANREVASWVARYPRRLWGFAFVHAERDKGRVFDMVQTAVKQYGFRGIKVHRRDAPLSREICETAAHFGLPVLYDVVDEVATIELFARQYPKVNFIIPHLGSFADDWKAQLAITDHLVRHNNVFTDTSDVRRFDLLLLCYKRAGASKIIFGSDGPWLHPGVEVSKIFYLKAPASDTERMLSGNILSLIGAKSRVA
ncbi:MAG: amidohydrolase family protein [Lewinellaceae bacterium]|nr:amidohydrolase family protein [Lewinellaceae bacterium]